MLNSSGGLTPFFAVSAVLIALTKAGDHIVCSQGLYGCTFGLLQLMKNKYNINHDFCAMESVEQLSALIRPETACTYVETPINPTMNKLDLEMIAQVGKQHGIPVVVDNTFSTPYLQRLLDWGCDIVLHSATKYICGHGDVVGGLVVGKKQFINSVAIITLTEIDA
ncbi:hypothetical protein CUU64_16095 [Bacillus sp. V5-8f]|nr:hypothetical protein CUU64_16095 [Bacillus sp. V5-8f]